MKAISVRQPWAWLIMRGGKTIENRKWSTKRRGRHLIQAAMGMTRAEWADASDFLIDRFGILGASEIRLPPFEALERGGIIGSVEIIDCVTANTVSSDDAHWFVGDHGFVLRDPRPLPFVPFKGALSFFEVPESVVPAC